MLFGLNDSGSFMLRFLRHSIFCFFLLVSVLNGANTKYEMLRHGDFSIRYKIDNEKLALQVITLLNDHLAPLENFYRTQIDQPVTIMIIDRNDELHRFVTGNLPEWTGAVYLREKNTILLKNPSSWQNPEISFRRDLLHELSHAFFQAKFGSADIPLWYNEGLAEYLSGRSVNLQSGLVLSNAIWAKTIIPLDAIDSVLTFSRARAKLAYAQSLSSVLFLKTLLQENDLNWDQFHHEVIERGWDSAFESSLSMDQIDFEIAWYRHIEDKYRWLFILNLENLIWVALLLVLILGMYFIRYRNKKILQKWEIEESVYGLESPNLPQYDTNAVEWLNDKE